MDDLTDPRPDAPGTEIIERTLAAWGAGCRLGERLGGGYRNVVYAIDLGGKRAVLRWSPRPLPAVAWEVDLLDRLPGWSVRAPRVLPAGDGRRVVAGCVVMTWLDGDPPATEADWREVATTLDRLHGLTRSRRQRPGFAGTRELLTADRGGDVRLDLMPPDAVATCRAVWRRLEGEPRSIVHGDPGAANIRLTRAGVGLLDWDEARVDAAILDLASLPLAATRDPLAAAGWLAPARLATARTAADAWEAANGWLPEPSYARRRLAHLLAGETVRADRPLDHGAAS
jgi:Ser/Thr protein kinase RdoA (MazF antagonist)